VIIILNVYHRHYFFVIGSFLKSIDRFLVYFLDFTLYLSHVLVINFLLNAKSNFGEFWVIDDLFPVKLSDGEAMILVSNPVIEESLPIESNVEYANHSSTSKS
jgi:uncharacterized membrane protein required for colicin V production